MSDKYTPFHISDRRPSPSPDGVQRSLVADTMQIPSELRFQLVNILERSIDGLRRPGTLTIPNFNPDSVWDAIYDDMASEIGLPGIDRRYAKDSVTRYLQTEEDAYLVLTAIEVAIRYICINQRRLKNYTHYEPPQYDCAATIDRFNTVMGRAGFPFSFAQGIIVRSDSEYLTVEVVSPALELLARSSFDPALDDFRRALKKNLEDPTDKTVLTLANSSLESTMKHILKLRSEPYREEKDTAGSLIAAILKTGIVKPWQEDQLAQVRELLTAGAPRVRNKLGGHGAEPNSTPPEPYMISFGLHLAAATIVMLVRGHNETPMPT